MIRKYKIKMTIEGYYSVNPEDYPVGPDEIIDWEKDVLTEEPELVFENLDHETQRVSITLVEE